MGDVWMGLRHRPAPHRLRHVVEASLHEAIEREARTPAKTAYARGMGAFYPTDGAHEQFVETTTPLALSASTSAQLTLVPNR